MFDPSGTRRKVPKYCLNTKATRQQGAKNAWKAYEDTEISVPHHVRQRAGVLETVAINARHNIYGTA